MASKKKNIHVSLTENTMEILDKIKEKKGLSYSAIINILVQDADKAGGVIS